jgi:hypothetical protein
MSQSSYIELTLHYLRRGKSGLTARYITSAEENRSQPHVTLPPPGKIGANRTLHYPRRAKLEPTARYICSAGKNWGQLHVTFAPPEKIGANCTLQRLPREK